MNKSGDLNGSTSYLSDVCTFPVKLTEEMEAYSECDAMLDESVYLQNEVGRKEV